jgi:quercetin dioxygenase-like cupin family protein
MTQLFKTLAAGAALAAGLAAIPAASFAGECPADKAGVDVRAAVDLEAVGVTDTVLAALPLSETALELDDRTMRVRRLTIEPGGIVPWHSHADRPALILITKGEINEYASTCAAPIHHVAGEVSVEKVHTSHWWKNLGTETVELYSFDILHDETDHNM